MKFYFGYAGLVTVAFGKRDLIIHFFPKKGHRMWGRDTDYYLNYFGVGPLILFVW